MKSYNFFSSAPYSNNFLRKDDTACIAFRAAFEFYQHQSPYDPSPIMFLHPLSSRCDESLNLRAKLNFYNSVTDEFFLLARTGLYAGEAELILKKCDEIKNSHLSDEEKNKVHYLINSSLFILNKFVEHSIEYLGCDPVFNSIYIISSIKLDYLKNFNNKDLTQKKIISLKKELEKIQCNIKKTFILSSAYKYTNAFNASDNKQVQIADYRQIITNLDSLILVIPYHLYLRSEMIRRFSEYIFNAYFKINDLIEAGKISLQLTISDPYCPRAHFLQGKYLLYINEESDGEFATSLSLNNQEKSSIKKILSPNKHSCFFVDEVQQKKKLLERYGSFLNPTTFSEKSTISFGPWMQWYSILNNHNPLFQTTTSQRAMPVRFRQELFFALRFLNTDSQTLQLVNYDSFIQHTNPDIANYLNIKENNPLKKAMQSRLLSSLGFYTQAKNNLNLNLEISKTTFNTEEAYYFSTAFFIEQIMYPGDLSKIHEKYSTIWKKIPVSDETLRIRIAMQMSLAVIGGQRNQKDQLFENYKNLMKLMEDMDSNSNFSTFEKFLLKSRIYRASSYYPFITKDMTTLTYEINECNRYAELLNATNDFEKKLKRENKFPLYESTARTYSALGDHENAFLYMKKIIEEVDANDPKAWLQVGEYYERFGKMHEATECYEKATMLLCPLGKISSFKLGRIYEKNGRNYDALFAYLTSLQLWPAGPSPLRQISNIANQMNIKDLPFLVDLTLEKVKNDYL